MKEFKAFYFENFRFDEQTLKAVFLYSFDKAEFFEEEIDFSCENFIPRGKLEKDTIDTLLFQIHIALGISYYKLYPTETLFVESGFLSDSQLEFWKKFYKTDSENFSIEII